MNIILNIAIIINVLAILVLGFGLIFVSKDDVTVRLKSRYGVLLAIIMFLYLVALFFVSVLGIIKHNISVYFLIIFIIAPFLIGSLSNYYSRKKYTWMQFFCFIASLMVLMSLL